MALGNGHARRPSTPPRSAKASSTPMAARSRSWAPAARSASPAFASVSASIRSAMGSRRCGLDGRMPSSAWRAEIDRPWRQSASASRSRSASASSSAPPSASIRARRRRSVPSASDERPASIWARARPSSSATRSMRCGSSVTSEALGRTASGNGTDPGRRASPRTARCSAAPREGGRPP